MRLKTVIDKLKASRTKPGPAASVPPERVVPPPPSETIPDPPRTAPASYTTNSGLVTEYPDRSEWEADVSRRARDEIHAGKRPKRNKGPTTEAS